MNHGYLAAYDGSEQATGRGAGLEDEKDATNKKRSSNRMTPYMQMTYYPIERRLDTAIWRALFSSSVRQARQFCVHGLVKVNGKKMPYPGYMLNPGDMFQVEPDSVMTATGAQKTRTSTRRRLDKEARAARAETRSNDPKDYEPSIAELASQTTRDAPTTAELKKHMQSLMENVEEVLNAEIKAKDKQKFRAFRQEVKKAISVWRTANPESVSTLDAQFDFLRGQMAAAAATSAPGEDSSLLGMSKEDEEKLKKAFDQLKKKAEYDATWNKRDTSKPYLTPWRPRDYMSAFAFIPRYLEVNQNICAAVYLRHPVARPGLAEVPTPFHLETSQLAFNWYLRRR